MTIVRLLIIALVVLDGLGADAARRPRMRTSASPPQTPAALSVLESLPADLIHSIVEHFTDLSDVSALGSVSRLFRQHLHPILAIVNVFRVSSQHAALADRIRDAFRRKSSLSMYGPLPSRLLTHRQALGLFDNVRYCNLNAAMKVAVLKSLAPRLDALRDVIVSVDVTQDSATLITGLAELPPGPARPIPDLPQPVADEVISIAASCDEAEGHSRLDPDSVAKFRQLYPRPYRQVFPHNDAVARCLLRRLRSCDLLLDPEVVLSLACVGVRFGLYQYVNSVSIPADKVPILFPLLHRPRLRTAAQVQSKLLPVLAILLYSSREEEVRTLLAFLDLEEIRAALARSPASRVALLNKAIRLQRRAVVDRLLTEPDIGDIINGVRYQRPPLAVAQRTSTAMFKAVLGVRGLDFAAMAEIMGRPPPPVKPLTVLNPDHQNDLFVAALLTEPGLYLHGIMKKYEEDQERLIKILKLPLIGKYVNEVLEPKSGRTMLHIALQCHLNLIPVLMSHRSIQIDKRDSQGRVPFSYLPTSPTVIAKFIKEVPPAHQAVLVRSDLRHLFRLLSESARDAALLREIFALPYWPEIVNSRDPQSNDRTLLHMAFMTGRYGLVPYLLSVPGSDLCVPDRGGQVAIELIRRNRAELASLKASVSPIHLLALTLSSNSQCFSG